MLRPSVREPGTDGNHEPIGQAQNDGSSDSQEIPVSMENLRPGGLNTNTLHLQVEKLWEVMSV